MTAQTPPKRRRACIALALAGLLAAGASPTGAQSDADQAALCDDPTEHCGRLVAPACLSKVGAGAAPATPAPVGCEAQVEAYAGCLRQVAERCGAPAHQQADPAGALGPGAAAALGALLGLGAEVHPTLVMIGAFECYAPQKIEADCDDAPALVNHGVSTTNGLLPLFKHLKVKLFAVARGPAPGAPTVTGLVDVSPRVDPTAAGAQYFRTPLKTLPKFVAACVEYRADGKAASPTKGAVMIHRLVSSTSREDAQQYGSRSFMTRPLDPALRFEGGLADCPAQVAKAAKARGL